MIQFYSPGSTSSTGLPGPSYLNNNEAESFLAHKGSAEAQVRLSIARGSFAQLAQLNANGNSGCGAPANSVGSS